MKEITLDKYTFLALFSVYCLLSFFGFIFTAAGWSALRFLVLGGCIFGGGLLVASLLVYVRKANAVSLPFKCLIYFSLLQAFLLLFNERDGGDVPGNSHFILELMGINIQIPGFTLFYLAFIILYVYLLVRAFGSAPVLKTSNAYWTSNQLTLRIAAACYVLIGFVMRGSFFHVDTILGALFLLSNVKKIRVHKWMTVILFGTVIPKFFLLRYVPDLDTFVFIFDVLAIVMFVGLIFQIGRDAQPKR